MNGSKLAPEAARIALLDKPGYEEASKAIKARL